MHTKCDLHRILSTLAQCTLLTELQLVFGNNVQGFSASSDQLADFLRGLPLLRSLFLAYLHDVDSLSFLTSGPITSTLGLREMEGSRRTARS